MKKQLHTPSSEENFFAMSQAAKRLSSTSQTLHKWRKRGWLFAIEQPNGRFLVPESEIQRLLGSKAGEA